MSGGVYAAPKLYTIIAKEDIVNIDFPTSDFAFATSSTEAVTSTDENDNEIRTGIKIPIKYNFPVAKTSGYLIEEIDEDIGMTLDAYNMCRSKGKTQVTCTGELNDDIEQTVEAFKINKARELDELKRKFYQDELNF